MRPMPARPPKWPKPCLVNLEKEERRFWEKHSLYGGIFLPFWGDTKTEGEHIMLELNLSLVGKTALITGGSKDTSVMWKCFGSMWEKRNKIA